MSDFQVALVVLGVCAALALIGCVVIYAIKQGHSAKVETQWGSMETSPPEQQPAPKPKPSTNGKNPKKKKPKQPDTEQPPPVNPKLPADTTPEPKKPDEQPPGNAA